MSISPTSRSNPVTLLLGMLVGGAIFFQFHARVGGHLLNLNLADPLALIGLLIVGWQMLMQRRLPQWRTPMFNTVILACSALLLLGFAIGYAKVGLTFWALNGRVIGWLIVLGYLSVGYLVVAHCGQKGHRWLVDVVTASAAFIVIWQAITRLLYQYGWDVGIEPTPNFEGFSGNRNAFVFQLLTALALVLAYVPVHVRGHRLAPDGDAIPRSLGFILGCLLVGVVWTGSRAGMLTCAVMVLLAAYLKLLERKTAIWALVWSVGLWAGFAIWEWFPAAPSDMDVSASPWRLPEQTNLAVCAAIILLTITFRVVDISAVARSIRRATRRLPNGSDGKRIGRAWAVKPRTVTVFVGVAVLSALAWLAWPFDPVAPATTGSHVSVAQAGVALTPTADAAGTEASVGNAAPRAQIKLQSALSSDISNQERWATFQHGFELWQQSPIVGAGLGVFHAKSPEWLGHAQVIHSTPIWFLAEFGLLGVAVLGLAFIVLLREALPALRGATSPARAGLLLLLVMFGLMSQFHEVFFQRIFWLALGVLLAVPDRGAILSASAAMKQ